MSDRTLVVRAAHWVLLALAAVLGVVGGSIVARGLFDRSYDNTIWNYLLLGGPLLVVAGALVAFVWRDVRRGKPRGGR